MPFGEQIPVSLSGTKDRLSYIGKENDIESGLGDFGVRTLSLYYQILFISNPLAVGRIFGFEAER